MYDQERARSRALHELFDPPIGFSYVLIWVRMNYEVSSRTITRRIDESQPSTIKFSRYYQDKWNNLAGIERPQKGSTYMILPESLHSLFHQCPVDSHSSQMEKGSNKRLWESQGITVNISDEFSKVRFGNLSKTPSTWKQKLTCIPIWNHPPHG
jgi:hypothetical protein